MPAARRAGMLQRMEYRFAYPITVALVALCGCGAAGPDGVIVLNPGDGLPVTSYRGMDVADMNGDGLPDLVATKTASDGAGNSTHFISVFLNRATAPGTFAASADYPHGPPERAAWTVIAADIRSNGLPDVISTGFSDSGFRVLLQDPANPGALLQSTLYGMQSDPGSGNLALADIDGDLRPDVIMVGDELVYFPQDGANPGAFLGSVAIGEGTDNVTAGDADGDGLTDLLTFRNTVNSNDLPVPTILLYHRQNPATPGQFFAPVADSIGFNGVMIGLGDLNGDNLPDIVVSGAIGSSDGIFGILRLFRQSILGTFQRGEAPQSSVESLLNEHVIADLDGDGDAEIILGHRTAALDGNMLEIFTAGALGAYESQAILTIPDDLAIFNPELFSIEVADLNGDGQPDIAISTYELFVFFQRTGQPGAFEPATRIAAQR